MNKNLKCSKIQNWLLTTIIINNFLLNGFNRFKSIFQIQRQNIKI